MKEARGGATILSTVGRFRISLPGDFVEGQPNEDNIFIKSWPYEIEIID